MDSKNEEMITAALIQTPLSPVFLDYSFLSLSLPLPLPPPPFIIHIFLFLHVSLTFRSRFAQHEPPPLPLQIRASKPEGCTFNPKTNRRKSSSGSPVAASSGSPSARSSSRFDKLYLEAKQSKAKLERRRTQQKLKPTGCTFNPRTNADRKKKQNETGASASSASSSRSSRFQSLYADAAKTKAKIARERARRAASAGTFKPKITRKAQRAASPSPAARFERLYQDGRRDLQVQRAKQRADREMRDCTFSPRINKRSSTRSSSARRSRNSGSGSKKESFEDRLLAYGKRTEARLERKRMEAQNEGEMAQCTFTPKVNKNTTSFMRRRPSETAEEVSLRLSQVESKEQFERRMERRRRQLEEQKGATFKPRTSSNRRRSTSARRSRDDDSSDNRGSIWERLNTDRHTLEKRNQRLREERERRELAKCTFQPNAARAKNTTPKQRKGTKKKAAPAGSADQKQQQDEDERVVGASPRALGAIPVWERLSGVNMSALKIQRDEQKKKLEMAECTFQPKLAKPKSQAQNSVRRENDGDAGTPIWERLYAGRKDMEQIERLAAERELAACTFAPHISEESEHMASPDWKKEHTPIWTRLYADAMEEQKKETENERVRKELELHGCTFAPNIHIGDEVEEEEEEATR